MLPAIRVTGGSYHFSAAGWVQLSALGPSGGGANVSGCLMLTNSTAATVYYASSQTTQPAANPGPYPTGATSVWGNIPVPPNCAIIVSQPEDNKWWGASGALDITPCELIRS